MVTYTTYATPLRNKTTSLLLLAPIRPLGIINKIYCGQNFSCTVRVHSAPPFIQPLLCPTGLLPASFASLALEPPQSGPEASSPTA